MNLRSDCALFHLADLDQAGSGSYFHPGSLIWGSKRPQIRIGNKESRIFTPKIVT
jgi:hypothetical protein